MYNCTKNNLKGALRGVLIGYEPNAPECTNSLAIFPVYEITIAAIIGWIINRFTAKVLYGN